jgi:hypothetical protein
MRSTRALRNLGIGGLSAFAVLSAATFATATPTEELFASTRIASSASGQQQIRGKAESATGRALKGGTVQITRTVHGKQIIVGKTTIGSNGRFLFSKKIATGACDLVIMRAGKKATLQLTITSHSTFFIVVQQKIFGPHSIIGPVIFNY